MTITSSARALLPAPLPLLCSLDFAIPAAVTETLTRNGLWDLEMVNGGTVVRLLQGRAVVSLEVTR